MTPAALLTHIDTTLALIALGPEMFGRHVETVLTTALTLCECRSILLGGTGDDARDTYRALCKERHDSTSLVPKIQMAEVGPLVAELTRRERERLPSPEVV